MQRMSAAQDEYHPEDFVNGVTLGAEIAPQMCIRDRYADIMDAKLRQQVGVIDQQTASQRMVIEAQGIAQKRKIEGYTYQQERGFDVAEKVASDRKSTRLNSSHLKLARMPSSA